MGEDRVLDPCIMREGDRPVTMRLPRPRLRGWGNRAANCYNKQVRGRAGVCCLQDRSSVRDLT